MENISAQAQRIVRVYTRLAAYECAPVRLSEIRMYVDDADAALLELAEVEGVHLRAEMNQQTLTDEDREAAIRLGGEDRHNIQIEGI
jgi:hypothetical protein